MDGKLQNNPQRLTELRAKIDAVDESMHHLLMQRASVIDELIKVKGAATKKGAAFWPGREASMMKTIAERHSGSLPLDMVIHIWRDIISTFTYLQANYSVHLSNEGDTDLLRDMARFQFGFSVPFQNHANAQEALNAASEAGNALVVLALKGQNCWWQHLDSSIGFGIMARLPVINTTLPSCDAFVIAPPISDPVPYDMRTYAGTISDKNQLNDWTGGETIAIEADDKGQYQALIAIGEGGSAPNSLLDIRAVGGYFAPVSNSA
ncbi:MAG: chorismate mutase [Pseudomonadota bacterium]